MQNSKPISRMFRGHARPSTMVSSLLLLTVLASCGSSTSSPSSSSSTTTSVAPQKYFAPAIAGSALPSNYTFDDKLSNFSQAWAGPQILNAGSFSTTQRGLLNLTISTTYVSNGNTPPTYLPTSPTSGQSGSFALELAGQAGGFVQLVQQPVQQPVTPLVAANQCPSFSSAQTYQFVTIPGALIPPGTAPTSFAWDPTQETAFGSVSISTSGSTVNFQNIQQFTLPSAGRSGAPAQPPPSSLTGACGPTSYGSTIAVPGQGVITDPGVSGGSNASSPQAVIGIGPSGLLVEDNGSTSSRGGTLVGSNPPLPYDNVIGAGTGAVGLPVPSSAVDTGAVVGAQYLGFIYAAGQYNPSATTPVWSSHLASFGFSSVPSSCASVTASTGTLIYGGDFPQSNGQDNPSASTDGFGNCDFAIDLGAQDSANNGRYPNATVWVGGGYAANATGATYSFPAVAIAGQLNGKYAIFLIGEDSTTSQPWAIYLLQSN